MEYFVRAADGAALIADFRAFQQSVGNTSICKGNPTGSGPCSLFTGVRYGKADSMWMSPM
jgi:hypothetical protein